MEVRGDDPGSFRRCQLLQMDSLFPAPMNHCVPAGSTHVLHPLGLTGEGHQIVTALMTGPQDREATGFTRLAATHLQDDGVVWCESHRDQRDTNPVETLIPACRGTIGGALGIALGVHLLCGCLDSESS